MKGKTEKMTLTPFFYFFLVRGVFLQKGYFFRGLKNVLDKFGTND